MKNLPNAKHPNHHYTSQPKIVLVLSFSTSHLPQKSIHLTPTKKSSFAICELSLTRANQHFAENGSELPARTIFDRNAGIARRVVRLDRVYGSFPQNTCLWPAPRLHWGIDRRHDAGVGLNRRRKKRGQTRNSKSFSNKACNLEFRLCFPRCEG